MASPAVKRVVRTIGWAVMGWLVVGLVAGATLSWLDVVEDDRGSSLVATLLALLGAMAGGAYGWKHRPMPNRN